MVFNDMLGRKIELEYYPKKIISLVPSQTELLYDLGLEDEVIGITKFCIHPEKWFRNKKRIGGTKNLNISLIEQLEPDLIIANKEENTKEQIEYLIKKFPVYISDIVSINDSLKMIEDVGIITNKKSNSLQLIESIKIGFASLKKSLTSIKVAYFIWDNPKIAVGSNTFINSIIQSLGWENVFQDFERYPEISDSMIQNCNADFILLSSEPFPFSEKHISNFKRLSPNSKIILVDGEMFSWYGSRLKLSIGYLKNLVIDMYQS